MAAMGKSKQKKSKLNKKGKKEFKAPGKRGRLVVRNLPFKCNESAVHKHFSQFGEIKEVQLLKRPDNKLVGCGFVEYVSRLHADKATEQLNGKPFLGRPIYIERAVARGNYNEQEKDESSGEESIGDEDKVQTEFSVKPIKIKKEPITSNDEQHLTEPNFKEEPITSNDEQHLTEPNFKEEPHCSDDERENSTKTNEKGGKNIKKARLIVRNLSFKTTEKTLQAHFAQYGEVEEVRLLRKPDGALVGCGFVQFFKRQSAAKAIYHASGKPFLGRPVIVDWAVAKDKFKQLQEEAVKKEIKEEDGSDDELKSVDNSKNTVKRKPEEDSENGSESESSDSEDSDEEADEDGDDENEETEDESSADKDETESKRQRPDDVDEGKTVFVKKLPFTATDEEFQECMAQFGPFYYALICRDKLTEHSKGSGFVKFKTKEDAEKCLSSGTELTLKGNILDPHPALKRGEAQKLTDKKKQKQDNRNLYLVKEGLIIAGTAAAKGVSLADMDQRLQQEHWKTARLRNLNMFVSQTRLVVHNLPPDFSDKQLRKLFLKHAGPKADIKEARVMRNLKKVDTSGKGISKGFGFISFEKHEDALKALRSINNNPSIFSPAARPIVSFSIENRSVLNTKTKRMERSRQKNPLCKDFKPEEEEVPAKKAKFVKSNDNNEDEQQYTGITTKPGGAVKMRQNYKLKNQAEQHLQNVKKQKQESKLSRKMRRIEHLKNKQVEKKTMKKKKNKVEDDVAFSTLVDKYKIKMMGSDKKKWYD